MFRIHDTYFSVSFAQLDTADHDRNRLGRENMALFRVMLDGYEAVALGIIGAKASVRNAIGRHDQAGAPPGHAVVP